VTSIFLEGGRTLATAFIAADQIDESRIFVAPVLLGGEPTGAPAAARRSALQSDSKQVGDDTLITARFKEW
jgi:diaminohydroxyphosphoribosylaminopyrimidine deaminase/5-amino-6-(5-phosphoribosylamino)uracil reductase